MSRFTTVIPAHGPDGNVFAVLANARRLMRQLEVSRDDIESLTARVMGAASYAEALAAVRVWFPVDGDDDDLERAGA